MSRFLGATNAVGHQYYRGAYGDVQILLSNLANIRSLGYHFINDDHDRDPNSGLVVDDHDHAVKDNAGNAIFHILPIGRPTENFLKRQAQALKQNIDTAAMNQQAQNFILEMFFRAFGQLSYHIDQGTVGFPIKVLFPYKLDSAWHWNAGEIIISKNDDNELQVMCKRYDSFGYTAELEPSVFAAVHNALANSFSNQYGISTENERRRHKIKQIQTEGVACGLYTSLAMRDLTRYSDPRDIWREVTADEIETRRIDAAQVATLSEARRRAFFETNIAVDSSAKSSGSTTKFSKKPTVETCQRKIVSIYDQEYSSYKKLGDLDNLYKALMLLFAMANSQEGLDQQSFYDVLSRQAIKANNIYKAALFKDHEIQFGIEDIEDMIKFCETICPSQDPVRRADSTTTKPTTTSRMPARTTPPATTATSSTHGATHTSARATRSSSTRATTTSAHTHATRHAQPEPIAGQPLSAQNLQMVIEVINNFLQQYSDNEELAQALAKSLDSQKSFPYPTKAYKGLGLTGQMIRKDDGQAVFRIDEIFSKDFERFKKKSTHEDQLLDKNAVSELQNKEITEFTINGTTHVINDLVTNHGGDPTNPELLSEIATLFHGASAISFKTSDGNEYSSDIGKKNIFLATEKTVYDPKKHQIGVFDKPNDIAETVIKSEPSRVNPHGVAFAH